MFSMDTGWPPPVLLVMVNMQRGIVSAPTSAIRDLQPRHIHVALEGTRARRVSGPREPEGRRPEPRRLRCSPGWCQNGCCWEPHAPVGTPWRRGSSPPPSPDGSGSHVRSRRSPVTVSSNRKKEGLPAYASSPRMMPAHCWELMADVPESVRRSMRTSSDLSLKTLYPALFK